MYVWFHEAWGDEVQYLLKLSRTVGIPGSNVRTFHGLVIDLRTPQQHDDRIGDSRRRATDWYRDVASNATPASQEEWDRCGTELVSLCVAALSNLVGIVNAVIADPAISAEWATRVERSTVVDPIEEVSVVIADIGVSAGPGQLGHLQRGVVHDWNRRLGALTSADDAVAQLANTAERVVLGWSLSTLPCHYGEVLELAEVEPGREAIGALELAHAVADLVAFDSADEFLEHFTKLWNEMRKSQ